MNVRFKLVAVAASLLAHSGWALPTGTKGASRAAFDQQAAAFGSLVPCAVPLSWRIADVDSRFELEPSDARAVVEEAASLWEDAMDRKLFVHDATEGFPVGFEFDDRQALLRFRNRFGQELEVADQGLAARAAELARMNERFEAVRAEYEERVRHLQRRTEEHNGQVRLWNERGGAPALVLNELQRAEQMLRLQRESVERAEQGLADVHEWIRAETERLNQGIQARNRQADAFEREYPVRASESGRYRESVRTRNGEVVSLAREIRIFRFAGRDELILVIAHELGHALGLGHAAAPGAVMSDVLSGAADPDAPAIQDTDVEMLRARCPEL